MPMTTRLLSKKSAGMFDTLLAQLPVGLLVVDSRDLTVVAISEAGCRQFGGSRQGYEGRRLAELQPSYRVMRSDGSDARLEDMPIARACQQGEIVSGEQWMVERTDGSRITLLVNAAPVRDSHGHILGGVACWSDVSALKGVEADLRAALDVEEILLLEAEHRIKNHLEMVAGLVRMESAEHGLESSQLARAIETKLAALAAAQQGLLAARGKRNVLAKELVHGVVHALQNPRHPIQAHAEDVELEARQVTPLALIVNEAVSNAMKHAFPADRPGRIDVWLRRRSPGTFELAVEDDGVGLPEQARAGALGLKIVDVLVRQLDGTLTIGTRTEGGLRLSVLFPERSKQPVDNAGGSVTPSANRQ
jgi:PAS domain S-box-containing protein